MITNAQIKLLHTAKNVLHLADDDYRALLEAEAGVTSSKYLDNRGLNRVLKRLAKLGFVNTAHRPRPRRQPPGAISPEQMQLIADNYQQLAKITAENGRPGFHTFAAQTAFNRRCCGKLMPQTIADANKVIEGQKAIIARSIAE